MSKTLSVSIADKVYAELDEMVKTKNIGRSELVEEYIRMGLLKDKNNEVF